MGYKQLLSESNEYLLNKNNEPANISSLGTCVKKALGIVDEFTAPVMQIGPLGAAVSTADGAVNQFMTQAGKIYESKIVTQDSGASTTPQVTTNSDGIDISMDQTDGDIYEMNEGITARSPSAFTVGEQAFYAEFKIVVADVSGNTDLAVGFRKAEAYQSAIDDYDEMAVVNVISGDIKLETILNGGGTTTTDTTDNLADGEYLIVRVEVTKAGIVTYQLGVNSTKMRAPTVTKAFTFDEDEVVVPFLYYQFDATTPGVISVSKWEANAL